MVPAPKELDPSISLAALFGVKLRKLRLRAGWTQRELGGRVHISHSRIAQFELGKEVPPEDVCVLLDEVLGADGDLIDLWCHVERDQRLGFLDYEPKAVALRQYLAHCIPGLLQTEAYARELFQTGQPWCSEEEVEKQVAARMSRQALLKREEPPLLWVVLDEAVVRRTVGGPAVMREQLLHVVESAMSPHIEVQLIPFKTGCHAAMGGSVTLLSFENDPDVAYLEGGAFGKLMRDRKSVVQLTHKYGLVQAAAQPPAASVASIERIIEEFRTCKT
ncbi:helix-turn-helix domain-containing protein [Streptomyces sp. NPDC052396]|uniref:helix-turn-helix domain-containing protein n=1 Tax=Streptomyces sp. NPDC052396 TaxID=3365689 RepID=UPI0037CD7D37